jgi:CxxC motif-containing protein (DUF1111 family)
VLVPLLKFASHPRSATQSRPRAAATAWRIILALLTAACGEPLLPGAPDADLTLDGPIDGLTGSQVAAHVRGDGEFGRVFSPAMGLGPIFVASSCASCHVGDNRGHPVFNLTRFGRWTNTGFDPLESVGGPQLQNRAVPGHTAEVLPTQANATAEFMAPAVSGLGLLEAVDDATILALADPNDRNGDGISGRPSLVDSTDFIADIIGPGGLQPGNPGRHATLNGKYVGRFGRKARTLNLLHQTVSAYSQDMGVTTDLVPHELLNVQAGTQATDLAPDPEASGAVVDAVVFYLRTLRPPPRRNTQHPDVVAGAQLFTSIGCAACHTPTLRTGRSEVAPLDRVEFHPFTDLLLHDMGAELDDRYTEGDALPAEWRTTPLWGLGLAARAQGGTPFYMHDGRAKTLPDAIRLHGGEGARSRAAFLALTPAQQEQLLAYLRSL